ncbi:MAG: glutathione S-transferase family protein [Pseudomonadota bacterium]
MTLKIYANPGSGSACVEAVMSELKLPFERVLVNYTEDGIDDPDFIRINPRCQVPALVLENGACLTETLAILMHLADTHPDAGLAPEPGSFERARLDQWMSFTLANIYEGELRKNYPHRYVVGDPDPVEAAAEAFVLDNYRILEAACRGPYFFGEALTLLDVYLWMFVNWFEDLEEITRDCPKIITLAENVMKRPQIAPVHRYNFGEGLGWPEASMVGNAGDA